MKLTKLQRDALRLARWMLDNKCSIYPLSPENPLNQKFNEAFDLLFKPGTNLRHVASMLLSEVM